MWFVSRVSLVCALSAALFACGTTVDRGGTAAAAAVSGPPGGQCAPCSLGSECASGTCGQFAGDLYCGT
ncbi:MAG: hypothetical protein ACLQVI_04045, partial [Polyangiaceae bacterium]